MDFINEIEKVLDMKANKVFIQCKREMFNQRFLIQITLKNGLDLDRQLLSPKKLKNLSHGTKNFTKSS